MKAVTRCAHILERSRYWVFPYGNKKVSPYTDSSRERRRPSDQAHYQFANLEECLRNEGGFPHNGECQGMHPYTSGATRICSKVAPNSTTSRDCRLNKFRGPT
jgi:hypothetical protein